MKKASLFMYAVYIFLIVSGSVFGVGENTIVLGGNSAWGLIENRRGVTEVRSVRPNPVLILSSATGTSAAGYSAASGVLGNFLPLTDSSLDLSVSFDENNVSLYKDNIGQYSVTASSDIQPVDRRYARAGTGAALFGGNPAPSNRRSSNSELLVIRPQGRNALFAPGSRIRDFTIEFWLYPLNMENGEQILSWVSARPLNGEYSVQRIHCIASKNKLQWSFENFFASAGGTGHIDLVLSGDTPVIPKTWSHHLVRFDATTGMVEYIVNGSSETIRYATATGRENSEVYTPVAGSNGFFLLGENFMGMMDEFKIHNVCAGRSSIQKYIPAGGRVETRTIDLGDNNSAVVRVNVSGGRTSIRGNGVTNEFRENGRFLFSDDSEMNFFIRAAENPYLINSSPWVSFTPGIDILPGTPAALSASGIYGRYVQIAVDFYPSADGETSPYIDEVRIVYNRGEPPLPPRNLTAAAVDGGVLLRWKHSPNTNTEGYLVYYSAVRGELFGEGALLGASPVNAGYVNSLYIDGLKNGTLYYFRIAAYDYVSGTVNFNTGEFSGEVTARPLAGLSIQSLEAASATGAY